MTTISDAFAAIRSDFLASWGSLSPVADQNIAFTPPNPTTTNRAAPWCRLTIRTTQRPIVAFQGDGKQTVRQFGQVEIQLFVRQNVGMAKMNELIETSVRAFEARTIEPEHIVFPDERGPGLQNFDVGPDDAGWYQTNTLAEFYYDTETS